MLSILRAATDEFGQTVVIVTHDPRAASYADRVVFLADGQIVRELRRPSADDVFEVMRHLDGAGRSGDAAESDGSGAADGGKHEATDADAATDSTTQGTEAR